MPHSTAYFIQNFSVCKSTCGGLPYTRGGGGGGGGWGGGGGGVAIYKELSLTSNNSLWLNLKNPDDWSKSKKD